MMDYDKIAFERRSIRGYKPDPVPKEVLDEIIVITVAMGYPADDFAANDVVSRRRPTDDIVTYVGFED